MSGVSEVDAAARLRTPDEYRESLRDGRRVYYRGERVEDVTTHAQLRHAVDHAAATEFGLAESPEHRELAVGPDGYSRFYQVPRSAEDLLTRSELIETGTRAARNVTPLIKEIGSDALLSMLAMRADLGEPYAGRIEAFYKQAREQDLALCVAQTDFKGNRILAPSKQPNPDAYLRIVEHRDDGIVVRGAKAHTSASANSNEMIVLPTRAMGPDDSDYAVSFAIPVDTPGLSLVVSPFCATDGKNKVEHPIGARTKMAESSTLFDDVFVPSERVFLAGEHQHAGPLAYGFVEFHRFTAISYRLPFVDALVGSALLAAWTNGIERKGHVREKLSWLISYAETLRALTHHAALECSIVDGVAIPKPLLVNIAKLHFAQGFHTAVQHVQDIAGGLLVTYPSPEDLEHPDYGPALTRYLEAAGHIKGEERMRLFYLISEMTSSDLGGYSAVLAIHAEGTIEAEKLTILTQYDGGQAIDFTRWLAGIDGASTTSNGTEAG
ncbi:MAG TPA: 4-hydroxyphenylacetate 3-hydroxylase N-terminal domain-containing protein [Solirubrobacterales bacterium]|nr:4-hydroxyphenylacetate 3-hydroxylase N-terminal domain-containing protein [Solirubrobacterales bacterium]